MFMVYDKQIMNIQIDAMNKKLWSNMSGYSRSKNEKKQYMYECIIKIPS